MIQYYVIEYNILTFTMWHVTIQWICGKCFLSSCKHKWKQKCVRDQSLGKRDIIIIDVSLFAVPVPTNLHAKVLLVSVAPFKSVNPFPSTPPHTLFLPMVTKFITLQLTRFVPWIRNLILPYLLSQPDGKYGVLSVTHSKNSDFHHFQIKN